MGIISFSPVTSYRQIAAHRPMKVSPSVVARVKDAVQQESQEALALLQSTLEDLPPLAPSQKGLIIDIKG